MPTPLETAVILGLVDLGKLHEIVQGDATDPDISTENGPIPTVARRLAEIGKEYVQAVGKPKEPDATRIVFVCDDGSGTDYTVLRPIFKNDAAGIAGLGLTAKVYNPCVGTLALISNTIDTVTNMSVANCLAMQADGWEMACHSKTHVNVSGGTTADKLTQIVSAKEQMEALGIFPKNFVWPFGASDAEMRTICARHFRSAVAVVTTGARRHIGPIPQFALHRYGMEGDSAWQIGDVATVGGGGVGTYATLQDRKNLVDAAIAEGGMLIFMVHSGPLQAAAGKMQMLIDLLEYIQGRPGYGTSLKITTLDEALDTHGNKLQVGDYITEAELVALGQPQERDRAPFQVIGANNVQKNYTGQELWRYEAPGGRTMASGIVDFARGHITQMLIPAGAGPGDYPGGSAGQGMLTTYRISDSGVGLMGYDDAQEFRPYAGHAVWRREPLTTTTWNPWVCLVDPGYTSGPNVTHWDRNAGVVVSYQFAQGAFPGTVRSKIESGNGFAYDMIFSATNPLTKIMGLGYGGRAGVTIGATILAGAAIAPANGIAVQSDVFITTNGKGVVMKDSQGTPHYWRLTVSNAGALVITDTGTVAPT